MLGIDSKLDIRLETMEIKGFNIETNSFEVAKINNIEVNIEPLYLIHTTIYDLIVSAKAEILTTEGPKRIFELTTPFNFESNNLRLLTSTGYLPIIRIVKQQELCASYKLDTSNNSLFYPANYIFVRNT